MPQSAQHGSRFKLRFVGPPLASAAKSAVRIGPASTEGVLARNATNDMWHDALQ
jgi:hypothetical protein